ncbi:unnamed protein product [Rhizoctonia solani]|uniref:RBR-type E3 ubiquitin transferase n=1 Tax=Rhizoctonia solani TaxID=456999 RepID=A0A8H3DX31_9AGAM|nr:unnamed protein product [Rhizoctonia solani]
MSSLTLVLDNPEDVFGGLSELPLASTGAFLSRSRVTYRGPNTYRSKRRDVSQIPKEPLPAPVCQICLENEALVPSTARCSHDQMICAPCLGNYLLHSVKVEGLTTLVCPAVKCEEVLEFNALLTQRELERDPNFRWCTNIKCGKGKIHDGNGPIVTCDHCHEQFCFVHRVPWHHGSTCEEYTIEREKHANQQYLTTHTKQCPNPTCGLPIEKIAGCDHMTCRCRHKLIPVVGVAWQIIGRSFRRGITTTSWIAATTRHLAQMRLLGGELVALDLAEHTGEIEGGSWLWRGD